MKEEKTLYERVIAEGEHIIPKTSQIIALEQRQYGIGELEKIVKSKSRETGLFVLEEKDTIYFAMKTGCLGCSEEIGEAFKRYFERKGVSALREKKVVLLGKGVGYSIEQDLIEATPKQLPKMWEELPEKVWEFGGGCGYTIALLMARFKYKLGAESVTYIHASKKPDRFEELGKI